MHITVHEFFSALHAASSCMSKGPTTARSMTLAAHRAFGRKVCKTPPKPGEVEFRAQIVFHPCHLGRYCIQARPLFLVLKRYNDADRVSKI